jgi:MFS family permease
MDLKTKFIIRALLGFSLGMIIGAIMYVLSVNDNEPVDKVYLLMQLFGSGIMGIVGNGGAIVYDFEDWGLGRATFTHYIVTFFTMLSISEILGWFSHDILLIVVLAFSFVYLIIWGTEYFVWKKEIRQMNRQLGLLKGEQE